MDGRAMAYSEGERDRSLYAIARPSVCLSSVVCNVHAPYTQPVEIFGNVSTPFGTLLAIRCHNWKFYGDRPRGTPLSGG